MGAALVSHGTSRRDIQPRQSMTYQFDLFSAREGSGDPALAGGNTPGADGAHARKLRGGASHQKEAGHDA